MVHRLSQRDFRVPSFEYRLEPPSFYAPMTADTFADTATSLIKTATCTGDGVAHTKGPWTQVIATTAAEITKLLVTITNASTIGTSATDTSTLVDVGVGAAAAESAIVSNIAIGGLAIANHTYPFIVYVPAGSRLSVRCQGVQTSKNVSVALRGLRVPNSVVPATTVTTFGANTAASQGTLVPTGLANAKGAWTNIGSATTVRLGALTVSCGNGGDIAAATAGALLDIGYTFDAGSTWTTVETDIGLSLLSTETWNWPVQPWVIPCNIPVGAQLGARVQMGNVNNNNLDVCIHGSPWRM